MNLVSDSDLDCNGDESCANSLLSLDALITCPAYLSCANSHITAGDSIEAGGAYSLYNTTVVVVNHDISFIFRGHRAGYKARIECLAPSTCTIKCYAAACFGLSLTGDGTILTELFSFDTLRPIQSFSNEEIDDEVVLFYADDNDAKCTTNFDTNNTQLLTSGVDLIANTNGSLCCRGMYRLVYKLCFFLWFMFHLNIYEIRS